MLLPGYVTDAVGILCFVPGLRFIIGTALLSRLQIAASNMFGSRFAGGFQPAEEFDNRSHTSHPRKTLNGDIIEGILKKKLTLAIKRLWVAGCCR